MASPSALGHGHERDIFHLKARVLASLDSLTGGTPGGSQDLRDEQWLARVLRDASACAQAAHDASKPAIMAGLRMALYPIGHCTRQLTSVLTAIKDVEPAQAAVACNFVLRGFSYGVMLVLGVKAISGVHFELSALHTRQLELKELQHKHGMCEKMLLASPSASLPLLVRYCGDDEGAVDADEPSAKPSPDTTDAPRDGPPRYCIMGAAAYNDGGLLRVRDDLVSHYAAHGVKLTASSSAAELRACTDEDFDGTTTAAELVRLMTSKCITFPDPQPPSLVTVESRRDLLRGC